MSAVTANWQHETKYKVYIQEIYSVIDKIKINIFTPDHWILSYNNTKFYKN